MEQNGHIIANGSEHMNETSSPQNQISERPVSSNEGLAVMFDLSNVTSITDNGESSILHPYSQTVPSPTTEISDSPPPTDDFDTVLGNSQFIFMEPLIEEETNNVFSAEDVILGGPLEVNHATSHLANATFPTENSSTAGCKCEFSDIGELIFCCDLCIRGMFQDRKESVTVLDQQSVTSEEQKEQNFQSIDEFTSLNDVFRNGFDGPLTYEYRHAAIKVLKIDADNPSSLKGFDFSPAIPPVFRDDEPITQTLTSSLRRYATSYQYQERSQKIIRDAEPLVKPLLENGFRPANRKLGPLFREVMNKCNWSDPVPTLRTVLSRATHSFLLNTYKLSSQNMNSAKSMRFGKRSRIKIKKEIEEIESQGQAEDKSPRLSAGVKKIKLEEPEINEEVSAFSSRFQGELEKAMLNKSDNLHFTEDDDKEDEDDGGGGGNLRSDLNIDEITHISEIYTYVLRNEQRKRVMRKEFRAAMLKRLNVTLDNPQDLSSFDLSPAIPSFLTFDKEKHKVLEKQIYVSVREHQKYERGQHVYRLATDVLGIRSYEEAQQKENELLSEIENIIKNKNWTFNIPSIWYIKHHSKFTNFNGFKSGAKQSRGDAADVINETPSTSRAVRPSRHKVVNQGQPSELADSSEVENAKQIIANMTNLSEIYKDGHLKISYRRLASMALKITAHYPSSFVGFDVSPAIPPFVKNNPEELISLRRILMHFVKNSQRHQRCCLIIAQSGKLLRNYIPNEGERADPKPLRKIFEKQLHKQNWPSNSPSVSLIVDRATRAVMIKAVEEANGTKVDISQNKEDREEKNIVKGPGRTSNDEPDSNKRGTRAKMRSHPSGSYGGGTKDAHIREIVSFVSMSDIYKNGQDGTLTESYRRSALNELKISPDYPEGFSDFDYNPAIPSFVKKNPNDVQKLKIKLRTTSVSFQVYARAKMIIQFCAEALAAVTGTDEQERREKIVAILENARKRWTSGVPTVGYLLNLMPSHESSSSAAFGYGVLTPLTSREDQLNMQRSTPVSLADEDCAASDERGGIRLSTSSDSTSHSVEAACSRITERPEKFAGKSQVSTKDVGKALMGTVNSSGRRKRNTDLDNIKEKRARLANSGSVHRKSGGNTKEETDVMVVSDNDDIVDSDILLSSPQPSTSKVSVNRMSGRRRESRLEQNAVRTKDEEVLLEKLIAVLERVSEEKSQELMARIKKRVNRQRAEQMLSMTRGLTKEQRDSLFSSILNEVDV